MKILSTTIKNLILVSLFTTIYFTDTYSQCSYVIDMEDSYGDGWNGASIGVEVNGTNVANVTITTGSSGTASISTYTDDIVDFIFTGGTWDSEITFQIYDPSGAEIYNGGDPGDINFLTSTSNSNCDPPNCMPPSFFSTSNLTAGSVEISWTSPDNSIYSNIEYGEVGFSLGNGSMDSSSNNTFSIEGLSPITTYDIYIQAVCDVNDVSEWAGPFSFTTPCAALTPPQLEDFEQGFPPNDCWDVANNGDPSTGPTEIGSSSWFTDGFGNVGTTGAVKINLYLASKSDWVLSPQYNLNNGGPFQVEFDFGIFTYANSSSGTLGSDDEVQILITRDGGGQWDTLARYDNTYITSSGGDHIVLTLPEDDGIVQFAIWASEGSTDDTPDNDVIFDNFAVNAIPSCPPLTNINVTNITSSSANIEWTPGISDSIWLITYGNAGFNIYDSIQTSLATNAILLENLEDNEAYDFYVQAICLDGDTNALQGPITFTTNPEGVCGFFNLELFDSYGDGWNGAAIDVIINGTLSETITLTTGSGPETFSVYGIEGDIVEFSFTSGIYDSEVSFIITDPSGYEVYNGGDPGDGIFTNPIESCPSCPQPQNIDAYDISFDYASLTWSSIATDSIWIAYLTPSGTSPDTSHQTITTSDSITYNGLTDNTAYDFYVKEICELGDTSFLSGPYTFLTSCLPISAPYEQNFDNTNSPEIDQCWTVLNSTSNDFAFIQTDASAFNPQLSAPNSISFYNSGASTGNLLLISPEISDLDSSKRIRFYVQNNGSQYNEADLIVGTMSDPTDAATFSVYDTILNSTFDSDQWQEVIVNFDNYNGDHNYIALGHGMNFTYDYVWIDDFVYEEIPSCVAPSELTVASMTSDSVFLSWVAGGSETSWLVYLVHDTSSIENVIPAIADYNNISLSIDPNTPYSYYVQGICGVGDTSRLIGPEIFNTPCISLDAFPYIEEFSSWPPNCWDLSGGTQSCVHYNNSAAQASFYSWSEGNNALMTSPVFDVSSLVSPELIFDWSHAYSSFYPNDALEVLVSDDGGINWEQIWYKTAEELESNDGADTYNPGSYVSSERINLAAFENAIMIRFNFMSGWGPYCFIDNVEIKEAPMNDIGISNVNMPLASSGCEIGTSALIMTIYNYGFAPQTEFNIEYSLNSVPYIETVFDTIQGGDSLVYTFMNEIDLSEDGVYDFTFTTNLDNDSDPSNDSFENLSFENFFSPSPPSASNDTICCTGETATLTASGPDGVTIDWFDSIGGPVLASGNTFITPPINTSTTYWAAYRDLSSLNLGPADYTFGGGGYYNFTGEGLVFDVINEVSLDSITVFTSDIGTVRINISNTSIGYNNDITYEITGAIPSNGAVKIPIGVNLQPGENYTMTLNENPTGGLYRNTTGANYPYNNGGNITITGATNAQSGFYFFFYNWEISNVSCYSDFQEVYAYIDGIWSIKEMNKLDFSIIPNPNNGFFEIITNGNINPNTNLTITDITGKVVTREKLLTNNYQVDISGIEKGVYIINVSSKSLQSQKRVVIH